MDSQIDDIDLFALFAALTCRVVKKINLHLSTFFTLDYVIIWLYD